MRAEQERTNQSPWKIHSVRNSDHYGRQNEQRNPEKARESKNYFYWEYFFILFLKRFLEGRWPWEATTFSRLRTKHSPYLMWMGMAPLKEETLSKDDILLSFFTLTRVSKSQNFTEFDWDWGNRWHWPGGWYSDEGDWRRREWSDRPSGVARQVGLHAESSG